MESYEFELWMEEEKGENLLCMKLPWDQRTLSLILVFLAFFVLIFPFGLTELVYGGFYKKEPCTTKGKGLSLQDWLIIDGSVSLVFLCFLAVLIRRFAKKQGFRLVYIYILLAVWITYKYTWGALGVYSIINQTHCKKEAPDLWNMTLAGVIASGFGV